MTIRTGIVFLFLLAVAVFESSLGPALGFVGGIPNVVLVLIVSWALVRGSEEGMIWGMLGGLSVGLLSGAPLGAHALMMTIIGFGAGLGQRNPFRSRLLVPLFSIVIATLVYNAGLAIILRLSGWPLAINPALVRVIVPALLANAVLMPFVYWLVAHVAELPGGLRPEF